jgi:Ca-activated chloride channel family protein
MAAPSGKFRPDLITESAFVGYPGLGWFLALTMAATGAATAQFVSGVNAVEVYATVSDSTGAPLAGLGKDDFVVRENGEVQQVTAFAAGQFPLAVALAVDRSFSMAGAPLAAAQSAARVFLGELRPEDEAMLIAIGSTIEIRAPLSRDRSAQLSVVAALDAFGTTGLHDAIIAAIGAIQPARGRRALVLLSDGSDRYSAATPAEALDRARGSDVLVYPVALGRTRPPLFAELATLTGGRSFHAGDPRSLPETMRAITGELRHQYLLGYTPSRPIVPGRDEWRSIAVTVRRSGVTVRARDGYRVK